MVTEFWLTEGREPRKCDNSPVALTGGSACRNIELEMSLQPYASRLGLTWLRDAPDLRYQSVEGTLVFADISGFTKLTERLAAKGRFGRVAL